jgi:sodium-dependent dicarboxylate transporter 2/3/5
MQNEWGRLGSLSAPQIRVAIIFTGTAILWIIRPYLVQWIPQVQWSDTAIALTSALLLFSVFSGDGHTLLSWEDTSKLPWGILILFGGGLALAGTLQGSYWFDALGSSLQALGDLPLWLWISIMAVLGVFATELLSNMALVSALMPLLLSLSYAIGIDLQQLSIPLVLGASCAFMLPMATPPNAIVFSTGKLTIPYMVYRGIVMNVLAVLVLVILAQFFPMPG